MYVRKAQGFEDFTSDIIRQIKVILGPIYKIDLKNLRFKNKFEGNIFVNLIYTLDTNLIRSQITKTNFNLIKYMYRTLNLKI
jgi:hypothetical protein